MFEDHLREWVTDHFVLNVFECVRQDHPTEQGKVKEPEGVSLHNLTALPVALRKILLCKSAHCMSEVYKLF